MYPKPTFSSDRLYSPPRPVVRYTFAKPTWESLSLPTAKLGFTDPVDSVVLTASTPQQGATASRSWQLPAAGSTELETFPRFSDLA